VVKSRYNQRMDLERSILQEFLSSEDMPNVNTQEAREIFATDQLLQLGQFLLIQDDSSTSSKRTTEENANESNETPL
jgi:hypothetical protein